MMAEDVELCLEVQVDPASKRILSNPQKCRSALLDVTVVKPKELEAFGTQRTNTLRAEEVRKLITSMERQRRKKQKILDKLKDDDVIIKIRKHDDFYDSSHRSRRLYAKHKDRISSKTPIDNLERKDFIGIAESVEPLFCEIRRSLKNVETRITNMQNINLMISQTTIDQSASEEYMYKNKRPSINSAIRNQSVYRVETAPHDLKSVLVCKNKQQFLERGDKIEGKCLCENCGIVGLLMECQKHPLLNEPLDSAPPSNHTQILHNRKRTRFRVPNIENWQAKNYDYTYVNHLSNRVKLLEERLAAQEERIVPKDYFKKIITKMVNNFSPKLFKSKSDTSLHCTENKNYDKKKSSLEKTLKKSPRTNRSQTRDKSTPHIIKSCNNAVCHHQVDKPKDISKNDKSTITEDDTVHAGYIWKWGEEILRPGVDLKNRIVTLLNEIFSKLNLNERAPIETPKSDKYDSETFRMFMQQMNAKVFNAHIDTKTKFLTNDYDRQERERNFESLRETILSEYAKKSRDNDLEKLKSQQPRRESEKIKNVNVSYINPKLSLWRTESPDVHKPDVNVSQIKNNELGKQEFKKIVTKAKHHQKEILWKNIWNQAKANGQTKNDVITIKIPSQNKDEREGQKLFETEITIGEVEEILKSI